MPDTPRNVGDRRTGYPDLRQDAHLLLQRPTPAPFDAQDLLPHAASVADVNNDVVNDINYIWQTSGRKAALTGRLPFAATAGRKCSTSNMMPYEN
ncbi:hypothetical protein [Caenispirillum salinarum]|uniref:hypothetical protein n=1 Tax=Caenispirillum salinarum TaxID=859058 RepID=UPI001F217612|nr:hypothetical protein [Caenispirillum salinarum]